jgi:mono/diheme cytochrome c family protein
MMKTIIYAAIIAIVAAVLFGAGFVYFGVYNVAASEEHFGATKWLLSTVKTRSVAMRSSSVEAPDLDSGELVAEGAAAYRAMCATCHGGPGEEPSVIGLGLNPLPPDLSEAATYMSDSDLFWVIDNGIKMTGMPAFGATHSDQDLWAIVAFLKQLPEMDESHYDTLSNTKADQHGHRHGDGHSHGKSDERSEDTEDGHSHKHPS